MLSGVSLSLTYILERFLLKLTFSENILGVSAWDLHSKEYKEKILKRRYEIKERALLKKERMETKKLILSSCPSGLHLYIGNDFFKINVF